MSVMRCEYNSLMIIICTVTLQRLKIGKRVTAVKPRDSLTGTNILRGIVCFCVCVWERKKWMKDRNRVNESICALVTFYEEILQSVYILRGIFAKFWGYFTFLILLYVHMESTELAMISHASMNRKHVSFACELPRDVKLSIYKRLRSHM